jgi:hypothetical protein
MTIMTRAHSLAVAIGILLALTLTAYATPNGNPFTRGSKFQNRARIDRVPKLGHARDGRYSHWFPIQGENNGGAWSQDEGWLAPPTDMGQDDLSAYRTSVQGAAGNIQGGTIPPINWNGIIYVAARDYFSVAGTTAYWDQATSSAQAKLPDGRVVILPLNKAAIKVDAKQVTLAHPSVDVNDTMMVPLRDLSDALGFSIQWDPDRKQAFLIPTTGQASSTGAGESGAVPDKLPAQPQVQPQN